MKWSSLRSKATSRLKAVELNALLDQRVLELEEQSHQTYRLSQAVRQLNLSTKETQDDPHPPTTD